MKTYINQDDFRNMRSMGEIRELSPQAFEYFSKFLLQEMGYENVEVSPKEGSHHADNGVDIYARHNGNFVVGQCKRWYRGISGYMPITEIRALGGTMNQFKAQEGVFISPLRYGKRARIFATSININLIGSDEIARVMRTMNPKFKNRSGFFSWLLGTIGDSIREAWIKEFFPRIKALFGAVVCLFLLWLLMKAMPYIQPLLQNKH